MTVVGFLLVLSTYILIGWYDYDFKNTAGIPSWVWAYSAVAHFTGYNLDGMDGKQARRTKTSTPLGELFDHGLDSIVAFIIPLTAASGLGLGQGIGLTEGIIFFTVIMGIIGFYLSHWEKYNTGVLFLPWIFDFVHQV
ncbi:Ethanolaminephosphotransferase 1-like [Oopsacas minuta]|uniref:Ethanolaminephosphotransferase 1-like n=1 Tax=Oopsacas minuta TaxID=111878 RepID=A0AAV7KGW1_9METZ|nr:Ethanolaminephosphotransferase 1-like [Oopsacas minuta]